MIVSDGLDYFSGKEIGQMAQHLMEVQLRLLVEPARYILIPKLNI